MPGWDIDAEESPGEVETSGRPGKEYYTIVVSYKKATGQHLAPHVYKLNADGECIRSTYYKRDKENDDPKKNKKDEYITIEAEAKDIKAGRRVIRWGTKKATLEALNSQTKAACNAVKAFCKDNATMLYYHNANSDACAMFGGVHWHIIIKSEVGANGNYRVIHDTGLYRTMKTKVIAAGGYIRGQSVRSLIHLVMHLNTPPRRFCGTNRKFFLDIWSQAIELAKENAMAALNYEECIDVEVEPDEGINSKEEKSFNEWDDDEDDDTPRAKKKRVNEWDDVEENLVVQTSKDKCLVMKETMADQIIVVLCRMMKRYHAFNVSEMSAAITKLGRDENGFWKDEPYRNFWWRVICRSSIKNMMQSALAIVKAEINTKSFSDLIELFCTSPDIMDRDKYESPEDSYRYFCQWCKKQKIDISDFVTSIVDVMDRNVQKKNTICIIGPSNSGKTVMVSQPIKHLAQIVGMVGSRQTENQFLWQDCPNCRAIIIDEAVFLPAHMEDLKLILGGEDIQVSVKFEHNATIQRTPVILTGNDVPWVLDHGQKDAFKNRMFYYTVKVDQDLENIKLLHPGMWWYLQQQYGQSTLIPLKKLKSYPSESKCELTSEDDPLC